jgi:hypothetical protein
MAMIRPDFIFSYWILAWFLWYYLVMIYGNHSYLPPNPIVAICIALIQNVLHLVSMILDHPRWIIVAAYVVVIGLIKGLPMYLLRKTRVDWKRDLVAALVVFGIYCLYLVLNGTNVYEIYKRAIETSKGGNTPTTPFLYVVGKLTAKRE